MTGWMCPGCKACYAPLVSECANCKPRAVPATTTTPQYPLQPYGDPGTSIGPFRPPPGNIC